MADQRSAASSRTGQREITLKQIQEQKAFVREYCQQFYMAQNQNDEDESARETQILDLQNNDLSTQRSAGQGPPQNKNNATSNDENEDEQVAINFSEQQKEETTGGDVTPSQSQLVPYGMEETEDNNNQQLVQMQEDGQDFPADMAPMMEEMESVLYSISFGKQETAGRTKFQSFSAAISNQTHVDLVLNYVARKRGIAQAKSCIVAYRVTSGSDGANQQSFADGEESTYVTEGYDDSNEEGCGQKLLSLLQRMGVENILIIVYIWHQRMPGHNSSELYKNVLERAKDLLTTLHARVIEAEQLLNERMQIQANENGEQMLAIDNGGKREGSQSPLRGTKMKPRTFDSVYDLRDRKNIQHQMRGESGTDLITKVYPSDVIPDQYIERKRDYRPNNFLSGEVSQLGQHGGQLMRNNLRGSNSRLIKQDFQARSNQSQLARQSVQDDEELEIELTEDEFHYAVEMSEQSIRRLTKAHIIDLRNIVKPHHLVEKVLNMVCILRGSIAPNWTMAREMMSSMTFKLELVLLDASKIKQSLIKRVIKVLNNFHRHLTPDHLAKINEGASILLTWIINLVKWNAGVSRYKFKQRVDNSGQGPQSIEQANRVDDLDVPQRHSLSQVSEDAAGYTGHQQHESMVDGQQSDDDDNRMNYKFAASNTQAQAVASGGPLKTGINSSGQPSRLNTGEDLRQSQNKSKNQYKSPNMTGSFLQSKQMVFGADKKLVPTSEASLPELGASGQFKNTVSSYGQIVNHPGNQSDYNSNPGMRSATNAGGSARSDNVLQAANQIEHGKTQLKQIINILEEDRVQMTADENQQNNIKIPETEAEIMQFLEQAQLENQPTEILYQLADRLKERRTKLYPEEKMIEGASSGEGFGIDDEEIGQETDRKDGKNQINFELGSDKQLKNIGSSQVFDQTVPQTNNTQASANPADK